MPKVAIWFAICFAAPWLMSLVTNDLGPQIGVSVLVGIIVAAQLKFFEGLGRWRRFVRFWALSGFVVFLSIFAKALFV
jgi:hypothetical protein